MPILRVFSTILLTMILDFLAVSQPPGGINGGQRGQTEFKKATAEDLAGVVVFDADKLVKKVKISGELKTIAKRLIHAYNQSVDSVSYANTFLFNACNKEIDGALARAMGNSNFQVMQGTMMAVRKKILPVQNEVEVIRADFQRKMKAILDDRSYKKFDKYVASELEGLRPQTVSGRRSGMGGQHMGAF